MNETVDTFLLTGDKFMPEMHLRQLQFTYSDCGLLTKKQRMNTKIQRNRRFTIYISKRTR